MDLHCDFDIALKTDKKLTVVQDLTCSKENVNHTLGLLKQALDKKTAACSDYNQKSRSIETRNFTEEFEAYKEQLATEMKLNLDVRRLCAVIEKVNLEAKLANSHLKEPREMLTGKRGILKHVWKAMEGR